MAKGEKLSQARQKKIDRRKNRSKHLKVLAEKGTQAKKEKSREPNIDAIPSTSARSGQF